MYLIADEAEMQAEIRWSMRRPGVRERWAFGEGSSSSGDLSPDEFQDLCVLELIINIIMISIINNFIIT